MVSGQEPGVVDGDEPLHLCVRPQEVLVVVVLAATGVLRFTPPGGNRVVLPHLVESPRDHVARVHTLPKRDGLGDGAGVGHAAEHPQDAEDCEDDGAQHVAQGAVTAPHGDETGRHPTVTQLTPTVCPDAFCCNTRVNTLSSTHA